MGYSATACVVYGVRLSTSDLLLPSLARGCRHPETAGKFCPECGKPMFVESEKPVEFSSASGVEIFYSDNESSDRVVGVFLMDSKGIEAVPAFDAVGLNAKIFEACRKQGLEVGFERAKLHLILRHSY